MFFDPTPADPPQRVRPAAVQLPVLSPEPRGPLRDRFGRRFGSLRVSLTPRCNFRCTYCRPATGEPAAVPDSWLTTDELARVVRVGASLGFARVRLTGGEPLLRRGAVGLVADLKRTPGVREVAVTTNASLLDRHAAGLAAAGVDRVNISLDSLDRDTAADLARGDVLPAVLRGIEAAVAAGLPRKFNAVVIGGVNDGELGDLVRFARDRGDEVRFIEYMPMGTARHDMAGRFVSAAAMRERLAADFDLVPVDRHRPSDPADRWVCRRTGARVGFIHSVSDHFCDACDRMRLTAEGELRPCLHQNAGLSMRQLLRGGADDPALADAFRDAAALKWAGHRLTATQPEFVGREMVSLGG